MEIEKFERMNGIASTRVLRDAGTSILILTKELKADGFDYEDIKEFIYCVVKAGMDAARIEDGN